MIWDQFGFLTISDATTQFLARRCSGLGPDWDYIIVFLSKTFYFHNASPQPLVFTMTGIISWETDEFLGVTRDKKG